MRICQALLYIHTTRTLAGLFLRMGHHLGELRKQLIRAPGENPFLPGHCCAMEEKRLLNKNDQLQTNTNNLLNKKYLAAKRQYKLPYVDN